MSVLSFITESVKPIVEKYNLILYKVENVKEYGMNIYRVIVDNELSFDIDIDDVAKVNQELLDIVNDSLPDDAYLEVTTLGIEREIVTPKDYEKALNHYIYVSTYEKIEGTNLKEFYGDLLQVNDDEIMILVNIKSRKKEITIKKEKIAKIRLAVKF